MEPNPKTDVFIRWGKFRHRHAQEESIWRNTGIYCDNGDRDW